MPLYNMSVGSVLPAALESPQGVFFLVDGSGIMVLLNFSWPTEKEIESWSTGQELELRICTVRDIPFLLIKAPGQNWVDAPIHPALCRAELPLITDSHSGFGLQLVMTDAANGKIKLNRLVGLGNDFSKALRLAISYVMEDAPTDYAAELAEVYNTYTTDQLVKMSNYKYKLK